MVNPSTADAATDDASIRKCIGFATRLGIARFIVGNKFAYRATDIQNLQRCADPVGPENDRFLDEIIREADLHIVAWGRLNKLPSRLRFRWREVVKISQRVSCRLYCLGTTNDGQPRHPLMVGYDTSVMEWIAPA
jgi:hypothetical protein